MFKIPEMKHRDKYRYYLTRYGARGVCEPRLANDCQVYRRVQLRFSCQILWVTREFGCNGFEARMESFLRL